MGSRRSEESGNAAPPPLTSVSVPLAYLDHLQARIRELEALFAPQALPSSGWPVGAILCAPHGVADADVGSWAERFGLVPLDGRKLPVDEYPELFQVLSYRLGGEGPVFRVPDAAWLPMGARLAMRARP